MAKPKVPPPHVQEQILNIQYQIETKRKKKTGLVVTPSRLERCKRTLNNLKKIYHVTT